MLHAQKANLQTNLRQRLLAIRERELDYYTDINRNIGNQAALIAGFAYSGIRYHYLVERQHSWQLSDGDSLEEVVFTSLLTMAMGCGLQTVLIAMLVAMLGPSLALRGGDGALHDAVKGMQAWTSAVLVLFLLSLFLLQARTSTPRNSTLRARARTHRRRSSPHPPVLRAALGALVRLRPLADGRRLERRRLRHRRPLARRDDTVDVLHARKVPAAEGGTPLRNSAQFGAIRLGAAPVVRPSLRRLRARAPQAAITGEFHSADHGGLTGGSHFEDTDGLSRRAVGCDATRIAGDDGRLLTAESLDAAMAAALRDERRGGGYDGRLRRAGGEEDEEDDDEGAALHGRRRGGGARNGGGGAGSALLGGRSGARNGGGRPRTPSGSDVAARVLKRLVLGNTERNTCFGGGDARGAYRTVEMTGG